MANNVTLSSGTMSNLLSLQGTSSMTERTQYRLSTGKAVNSAIDDAMAFFKNRNLTNRAEDFSTIKANIDNGINVVKTAVDALEDVESYLKQARAVFQNVRSTTATDSTTRQNLVKQFNELRSQIDYVANDASYDGINLIKENADTLTVKFSDDLAASERQLVVTGQDMRATGLSIASVATDLAAISNTTGAHIAAADSVLGEIEKALSHVRSVSQELGTNSSILEVRKGFTEGLINTLKGGAADLVNADTNEESANMLALQTRQQLGVIALSIAQQSEQAVLRLF